MRQADQKCQDRSENMGERLPQFRVTSELAAPMVVSVGTDDRRLLLERGNGWCSFDSSERLVACWVTRCELICEWYTGTRGTKRRPERGKEKETDLQWGPGKPTTLASGNLGSGTVAVTPAEGDWKAELALANVEAELRITSSLPVRPARS